MKQVLSALLCCFAATVGATKVAVLAEHNPTTCGSDGSQAVVECNLKVYIDATKVAAKAEVQLLVLPEGYGLVGSPSKTSFYEPLAVVVGSAPCRDLDAATHPVQAGLGCAAANQSIAIASNVFTTLPSNGTHYITEIVFDSTGTVIAIYHKHELFPIEEPKNFVAGPFAPTVFQYDSRMWGIAICYEGFYPTLSKDWSQFDALKRQGASALVWSVGSGPVSTEAPIIATRYNMSVVGVADGGKLPQNALSALVGPNGKALPHTDFPLDAAAGAQQKTAAFIRVSII